MYGYKSNFFNKDFIDSFRKSINESLNQGNKYGIGVNTRLNEDGNYGIGGEGDWGRVSDLQLQNRMRDTKRSNIFTGVEPDEKQTKEYLAARKEYERRQGAKNAPAPAAPKAAAAPAPSPKAQGPQAERRDPSEPNMALGAGGTTPSSGQREMSKVPPKPFNIDTEYNRMMDNVRNLRPDQIRPKGTPTAFEPRPGTPPLSMQQGQMTPDAEEAMRKASSTPAAQRQATKDAAAATDGILTAAGNLFGTIYGTGRAGRSLAKNAPEVVPVREPNVGSATAPGSKTELGKVDTRTGMTDAARQAFAQADANAERAARSVAAARAKNSPTTISAPSLINRPKY